MGKKIFTSRSQERRLKRKRFIVPIRESTFKQGGKFGFELSKVSPSNKKVKVLSLKTGFKTRKQAISARKKALRRLTKLRI